MKTVTQQIIKLSCTILLITPLFSTAQVGVGTTAPVSDLSVFGNTAIGTTYSISTTAPTNGLRVEGQTVVGKPTGEDSRDVFSAHSSTTSYNNVTGYGGDTAKRAIAGYSEGDGIGVLGYATRTGYGVVGLAHANTISAFVQQGEGVLGQADGTLGATTIPIGVHGIIDETTPELYAATPVLGENNNATRGFGLAGGAYNGSAPAVSAVYGNVGTKVSPTTTNAFQFGVVGDILLLAPATGQPDASGGVLGANAAGDYGALGYINTGGTSYSGYFADSGAITTTGTDKNSNQNNINNKIGIGVHGGFMGGYIKGKNYGVITKGDDFGMYVQGKTITNQPVVQLIDNGTSNRSIAYNNISTTVDINTRGKNKLTNGKTYVAFKKDFKNMIASEDINITITPRGASNGVYVSNVTRDGFYVKENMNGNSNISFNWVAIGTRKGYENGVSISNTILSNQFEEKFDGVMSNDADKGNDATPIHYDGNDIRFERIPEGIIKYNRKSIKTKLLKR